MFGEGQEHHTLKPILERIKTRFQRTGISKDIYKAEVIVTADTGFSNEANNHYLREENINSYIPDNRFRSRDPKFTDQKEKYGKRHQGNPKIIEVIPASEFSFNPAKKTCVCPHGNPMWLHHEGKDHNGTHRIHFEGRLTDCRQLRKVNR